MGFNTVAFFLNDQSDQIESDPNTIPRIMDSMRGGQGNDDRQYMTVLPSVHADGDQIIMAGGNRITTIGIAHGCCHTPEALMRYLAQSLGYKIVKRPATHTG